MCANLIGAVRGMSIVRLSWGKIDMGPVHTQQSMSANAWFRKLTISELCVVHSLPQCFHDQTDQRIGSGIRKNNQIE